MVTHSHHLGNDRLACPLDSEDLRKLLQIVRRGLADGEDGVSKPSHAQGAELLVKELNPELTRQQRNVFDDGQANAPLLVLRKLDDRGQERLRQQINSDDYCALMSVQTPTANWTYLG